MSNGNSFQETVSLALNLSRASKEDYRPFLSAIQDLSGNYPKEKKFLSQNLDDRYYAICMRAKSAQKDEIDHIVKQAENYLCSERMVARIWAHYISEQLVIGVWDAFHSGEYEYKGEKTVAKADDRDVKCDDEEVVVSNDTFVLNHNSDSEKNGMAYDNQTKDDTKDKHEVAKSFFIRRKRFFCVAAVLLVALVCAGGYFIHDSLEKTYRLPHSLKPSISREELNLGVGGNFSLDVKNVHSGDNVSWSSSNPSKVSVDSDGRIKAIETGDSTITAKIDNYRKNLKCQVHVNELTICTDSDAICEGEGMTLWVDGTDTTDIKWSSSDEEVIFISVINKDDGSAEITAEKCGVAKVIAKVDGQTLSYTPEVFLAKDNIIEVSQKNVEVNDNEELIYVAASFENDDSQIWAYNTNSNVAEAEFTHEWVGASTLVKIKKRGRGSTTITFYAADENDNRDSKVEQKTINVTCN